MCESPFLCILCRKLVELETQLIEAETAARVQAWVESKVAEALASEVVQQSLQQQLEEKRKLLAQQVRTFFAVPFT